MRPLQQEEEYLSWKVKVNLLGHISSCNSPKKQFIVLFLIRSFIVSLVSGEDCCSMTAKETTVLPGLKILKFINISHEAFDIS